MIYKGSQKITKIFKGNTAVSKVYRGAILVWQAVQEVLWNLQAYIDRVEADYGQVENSATLDAEVVTMNDYNDAIAIYNPNGGYRTGKIYNIRNLDGVEPTYDLGVTGGGGTRINENGVVTTDRLFFYNQLFNSHISNGYDKVGSNLDDKPGHLLLTSDSSTGNHLAYWRLPLSGDNNPNIKSSYQVELKKVNTRFVIVGSRVDSFTSTATIDLDTKTIVRDNIASAGVTDTTLEVLDDGWVRVSWHVYYSDVQRKSLIVGVSSGELSEDISFTGSGNSVMFRHAQSVSSNSRIIKPFQVRLGEYDGPAFPKVDYSTGQPAFLIEPQRTNYISNSYNFSAHTVVDGIMELNEIGITGLPNTASTLTDNSSSSFAKLDFNYINSPGSNLKVSTYIKKKTFPSQVCEIYLTANISGDGTTTKRRIVQFNPFTGESGTRLYFDGNHHVIDRGDWWEVIIIFSNANRAVLSIRPAMLEGDVYEGAPNDNWSVTSTGSIIVGHVGVYNSNVVNETPIITNSSAVTRTDTLLKIPMVLEDFDITIKCRFHDLSNYVYVLPSTKETSNANSFYVSAGALRLRIPESGGAVINGITEETDYELRLVKEGNVIKGYKNGIYSDEVTTTGTGLNNPYVMGKFLDSYGNSPLATIYSVTIN